MRPLWDDVRFAMRRLRQQPGFAAIAIATLALGLGANTAIFTLVHAVMLRPLPVPRPAELHRLGNNLNCCVNSGLQGDFSLFSSPLADHLRSEVPGFTAIAAFQANTTATGIRPEGGPAVSAPAAYVSANYFRLFGVTPFAGRLLEPGDDAPGAAPVMVLSHRAWVEQFGADRSLLGRTFYINGVGVTLAGVAAPAFFGETVRVNPVGAWLPLGQERVIRGSAAALTTRADQHWLYLIGRLAPDADPAVIGDRATHLIRSWLTAQTFLSERERAQIAAQRIVVTPAAGGVQIMRGNFGQSLTLLFAMSGLVLLIAAANLANLLLARADRAQAAVRAALGASSGRLARQALAEGLLLALAGGAGALIVSMAATRAILALAFPPGTVLPVDLVPSRSIVAFSIGLAIATGVVFAAAPAWAMGRTNPIDALRGLAREGADVAFMPRRSLVIVQVTLSLVLLMGAGLLTSSLSRLENQPMGFEADDRLVVKIDPPPLSGEPNRLASVYAAMQDSLERVPGVRRATYSLYSPMEGNNWSNTVAISGRPNPENRDSSSWNRVGPGYFETIGTRVVRGRGITEADTPSSARVAVVNLAFVRAFLADRDPIGVGVGLGDASRSQDYTIIGVVEDVKYSNASRPPLPMMFFPVMQMVEYPGAGMRQAQARSTLARAVVLHLSPGTRAIEPEIRRALAAAHPDITVTRVIPMTAQISGNFRNSRLLATLAAAYGVLALALASLGLYGVTSYGVSRRLHEIGVRMALGADRRRIVWGVLRGALGQTAAGLVVGVPLALAAGGMLTAQLFGVSGRDPFVLGVASAVLLVTAGLAAVVPARRAASVDPTRALRAQ